MRILLLNYHLGGIAYSMLGRDHDAPRREQLLWPTAAVPLQVLPPDDAGSVSELLQGPVSETGRGAPGNDSFPTHIIPTAGRIDRRQFYFTRFK